MKMTKCLILMVALICTVVQHSDGARRIVCFYNSLSALRAGNGRFGVSNIQPQLCSHLVYGFAAIAPNCSIVSFNAGVDFSPEVGYLAFTSRVIRGRSLPMLSVGGPNVRSTSFSTVVSSAANRQLFITSALDYFKRYNFKGLDIAWQYTPQQDKANFVALLKELRAAFNKNQLRHQISVSLTVESTVVANSYDLRGISIYADHINMKTFNFVFKAGKAVHHSPIKAVESAVAQYLNQGATREKLVLGVAGFGRSYTLINPSDTDHEAPISGPGLPGPYTNQRGYLGFNEICGVNFTIWFDQTWQAPYGIKGKQWVGFDNRSSIFQKCAFARINRLGGGMLWSIDTDDFQNRCKAGRFPLTRAINRC